MLAVGDTKERRLKDTCAEPRSKMFPANIPLTKFSNRSPSSSIASLRLTTSGNSDIAFAFSSSYSLNASSSNQRERARERVSLYLKTSSALERKFEP